MPPRQRRWCHSDVRSDPKLVGKGAGGAAARSADGSCALYEADDEQNDNGANGRVNDCPGNPTHRPESREKPAGNDCADDAKHDVADQAKAEARHDLTGKPAGDRTDDEPNNQGLWVHGSSFPVGRKLVWAPLRQAARDTGRLGRLSNRNVSAFRLELPQELRCRTNAAAAPHLPHCTTMPLGRLSAGLCSAAAMILTFLG